MITFLNSAIQRLINRILCKYRNRNKLETFFDLQKGRRYSLGYRTTLNGDAIVVTRLYNIMYFELFNDATATDEEDIEWYNFFIRGVSVYTSAWFVRGLFMRTYLHYGIFCCNRNRIIPNKRNHNIIWCLKLLKIIGFRVYRISIPLVINLLLHAI